MTKNKDDSKRSVKLNSIILEKNTLEEHVCVSITSHDEDTEKVFERARKQFNDMVKK